MSDGFQASEPIGTTDQPDSPIVDASGAGDSITTEDQNVCFFQGQMYSEGAQICGSDGFVLQCHSGKWEGTGRKCAS